MAPKNKIVAEKAMVQNPKKIKIFLGLGCEWGSAKFLKGSARFRKGSARSLKGSAAKKKDNRTL